ncbi:DUF1707 SHOCT-like domain-containing protein [Nocardia tengchongensis]|uniref:DUF1707 SHOCT-like domain-containing protein n=1 Tax=Nocardia tengchongensis TaxID=2055889 RepID=UPI0036A88E90
MSESPDVRVSAGERERALDELSRHFSIGRLTAVEFGERAARVWEAGDRRQLAEMFADLPAPPPPTTSAIGGVGVARSAVRASLIVLLAIVTWFGLGNPEWLLLLAAVAVTVLLYQRVRGRT